MPNLTHVNVSCDFLDLTLLSFLTLAKHLAQLRLPNALAIHSRNINHAHALREALAARNQSLYIELKDSAFTFDGKEFVACPRKY
jgi:hypothetical protein